VLGQGIQPVFSAEARKRSVLLYIVVWTPEVTVHTCDATLYLRVDGCTKGSKGFHPRALYMKDGLQFKSRGRPVSDIG
jgi:hypothetical protein